MMEKIKIKRSELLGSFAILKSLGDLSMDDSETNIKIAKNLMSVQPVFDILQKENNNKIKELGETKEKNGEEVIEITSPESKELYSKWAEKFFQKEEEIEIVKIDPLKLKGTITEKQEDNTVTVRPIPISGSVIIGLKPFLKL